MKVSSKPGYTLFLTLGATVAGCALASVVCAFAIPVGLTLKGLIDWKLMKGVHAGLASIYFISPFAAYYCFKFSFVPNFIGLYCLLSASLTQKPWVGFLADRRLYKYGSIYGMAVYFFSIGAMLVFTSKNPIPDSKLIFSPLFLPLLPAAMASGILNFKLVKIMTSAALA